MSGAMPIVTEGLGKRFGRLDALHDVDLRVGRGEIVGLMGANGAGKTTLLEILATLVLPSAGRASICGFDVVTDARRVRERIGYAPAQAQSFYPRLAAAANLEFFAIAAGLTRAVARRRVAAVSALVGLDGCAGVRFDRLSEGMKARLSIARALLTDAPVLLLDEPTRSLDPIYQLEIRRFLRETAADRLGKAALLVTHSPAEAASVCDRVAILDRGRLVAVARPAELAVLGGIEAVLAGTSGAPV
jgi:ABC-2 type transport system ATP-binding protein